MRHIITVACVNFRAKWGRKEANLEKIKEYIDFNAKQGVNLIIFPELALTGYDIEKDAEMHKKNAEEIPGFSTNEIVKLSQKNNIYVILGMPELVKKEKNILYYNSAAIIGPEGVIGSYRKMHPIFDELKIFSKGNLPFPFISPWGTIGIGICHDTYMFPEIPRFYAALGSRIYINLTAVPVSNIGWKEFYFNQLKARSLENTMFVASANLVGKEVINQYVGSSVIFGPGSGKESHQAYIYGGPASEKKEEVIISTFDLMETEHIRERYPLFEKNKLTGTPDWRLQNYVQMLNIIKEKSEKNKYIG